MNEQLELSAVDVSMAKQNFEYYLKSKGGATIELFELPMVLTACGYHVTPEQLGILTELLLSRKSAKFDF